MRKERKGRNFNIYLYLSLGKLFEGLPTPLLFRFSGVLYLERS
jgi:hypothetical protein